MRTIHHFAALASIGAVLFPADLGAQNLGPFRQFLAVEPFYSYTQLDAGEAADRVGLHGYGGRLWINTAPFGVTPHVGVGLFASYAPDQRNQGVTVTHYGGQIDLFPVHRPLGGVLDPFISVGAGALRVNALGGDAGLDQGARTRLSLIPAAGIRIPIPNRFQLRVDLRDAIVLRSDLGMSGGGTRTAHNLEIEAALGLTF